MTPTNAHAVAAAAAASPPAASADFPASPPRLLPRSDRRLTIEPPASLSRGVSATYLEERLERPAPISPSQRLNEHSSNIGGEGSSSQQIAAAQQVAAVAAVVLGTEEEEVAAQDHVRKIDMIAAEEIEIAMRSIDTIVTTGRVDEKNGIHDRGRGRVHGLVAGMDVGEGTKNIRMVNIW